MDIPAEIIAALIGGIVVLIGQHFIRRKTDAEANSINMDYAEKMATQLDRLEGKVVKLREDNDKLQERVEILEAQIDVKDATIQRLEARLTKILVYLNGLLRELHEKGIQYTPPEKGLLDTDPRIPAVKGGK